MTNIEEICSTQVIEFCRRFNRRMADKQAEIGARADDICIAAAYSAVDLAQRHTGGDAAAAIAWVRRALDLFEKAAVAKPETLQ